MDHHRMKLIFENTLQKLISNYYPIFNVDHLFNKYAEDFEIVINKIGSIIESDDLFYEYFDNNIIHASFKS